MISTVAVSRSRVGGPRRSIRRHSEPPAHYALQESYAPANQKRAAGAIGTVVAIAGPMSGQYASAGDQIKKGAEMAIADINARGGVLGQKLVLEVGDDACDPKQAVAVANQMVNKKIAFMHGHWCSSSTIPASEVYLESNILMATVSTNPKVTDHDGGQAVAIQTQLNFSRDMEREADRVGYGVATQAGFEPAGFVSMFEKLQQASRLNDSGGFPYLRSHPLTTERMADMQGRQQLLPARIAASVSATACGPVSNFSGVRIRSNSSRPAPSMLILISRAARTLMKSVDVNWLP